MRGSFLASVAKSKAMTRMTFPLVVICLVLILGVTSVDGQWASVDSTADALIVQGIHQIHVEDYKGAIETFEGLIALNPEHPLGYFGAASTYHTIMRNYRVTTFETEFDSLLDLTIQLGEKAVRKNAKDAIAHLCVAGARGFRGLHRVRKRDWIGGFIDGGKGIITLHRLIRMYPELYDAYFGLGAYHYWRSAKAKILGFLLFSSNDKQRGIDEVWTAVHKGRYMSIEAKHVLTEMYYDNGDYDEAFSLNRELYDMFPANPALLYLNCRIYEKQGKWEEAKIAFQRLLEHLTASEYHSVGYEVECHYGIALCHYELGEIEDAQREIEKALNLADKRDASQELEGPLEDFKEIVGKAKGLQRIIAKGYSTSSKE